jgi:hypothetical protein
MKKCAKKTTRADIKTTPDFAGGKQHNDEK